jgi:hypothetical protein
LGVRRIGDVSGGVGGALNADAYNSTDTKNGLDGQMPDFTGLEDMRDILMDKGFQFESPGIGAGEGNNDPNNIHGGDSTYVGASGGAPGWYGGRGGDGLYGAGGSGSASYSKPRTGGDGGHGFIVFQHDHGSVVRINGATYDVPADITFLNIWAVGAGGAGGGSSSMDSSSGSGGNSGAVVKVTVP